MKRRDRNRRLTIIAAVVIVAVSLVAGLYVALSSTGPSGRDKYDGELIPTTLATDLKSLSQPPYGPSGVPLLTTSVFSSASGSPYVKDGKPIVVYIGGEFCPYCAVERWTIIIALSRFGNFTNLHYMTSADDDGDYSTFTFTGSSYSSNYVVFQPFEMYNRSRAVVLTPPSNYTSENPNGGIPFVNVGNSYLLTGSIIPNPGILGSMNWTQIITGIKGNGTLGTQIKEGANAITTLICKVTDNKPGSVCGQSVIQLSETELTSYSPSGPSSSSLVANLLAAPASRPDLP